MSVILLACHGGESADGAVRVAGLLAERTGSTIDVVAVAEQPASIDYGYGPIFMPDPETEELVQQRLLAEVREQLERCGLGGKEPTLIVGTPAPVIASEAVARHAALVVTGLGAHHLLDRALGGETALKLAHIAATPVLAVPAQATALPRRIVAAVDFSETSLRAARLAASLLRERDTLELVHVASYAYAGRRSAVAGEVQDPMLHLSQLTTQLDTPTGARTSATVLEEDPARALLEFVERSGADLIVLGSHGRGAWQRLLLGSVASKVLRLAHCAVLVIPARCMVSPEIPITGAVAAAGTGTGAADWSS